ncbi:unnamed protein product [Ceutorhynchus assimilis]|uniref:Uncharacterized protein n=1 Tax=Ceutorhynchus assimilis TaxID=467358 RepID=A0A9N9QPW1_9CUCU|nr:unnamed protein product [Ceutorhynchus assimilis]
MTKLPKSEEKKPRATSLPPFKPDIRLANALIGAIAFLQKASLHATPKIIKKYILERCKSPKNMEQLPGYLNRGLELGILKKYNGAFTIGELQMVRKRQKKKIKQEKIDDDIIDKTSMVVSEAPNEPIMQDMEPESNNAT